MIATLVSWYRLARALADRLGFLPPLLARLAVGLVFVSTGWGKLHALDQITSYFRELGIPYPELQAPFVATVEFVCGGLVLVGLGARLAAIPLMGTMVVAIATAIWPDVAGLTDLLGRVEVLYLLLFAWIAIDGPGAVSLDALVARVAIPGGRDRHPNTVDDPFTVETTLRGGPMKPKTMIIASAAAALFLSGNAPARAEQAAAGDEVRCAGINACKSHGACAGAGNACAGQNACKGQGIVKTTAEDCKAKGGTVAPDKK